MPGSALPLAALLGFCDSDGLTCNMPSASEISNEPTLLSPHRDTRQTNPGVSRHPLQLHDLRCFICPRFRDCAQLYSIGQREHYTAYDAAVIMVVG